MTAHPSAPADRVVRDVPKNKQEIARVQLRSFKNVRLVDIRAHAIQPDGGAVATKKGLSLGVHRLRELIEALQEAERIARQIGWLGPDTPERKAA